MFCPIDRARNRTIDAFAARERLRPHRHRSANAALVLDGEFEEHSFDGRFRCFRSVILIHPAFHQHANVFQNSGAHVLTIHLPFADCDAIGFKAIRSSAIDELTTLAMDSPDRAGASILEESKSHPPMSPPTWMPKFIALLSTDCSIADAAAKSGVSLQHASVSVAHWCGESPARLRREGRLRRAMAALREGATPAEAAFECGFADQPHLTRVLKLATGTTPARWRDSFAP